MAVPKPTLIIAIVAIGLDISGTLFLRANKCFGEELSLEAIRTLPHEKVESQLRTQHPAAYIVYSQRIFKNKSKEDGVFWFYVGQLRYRFHLAANPELEPSGEPALFSSLMHSVGQPINKFAGSNPDLWAETIERALAWDAKNENSFTSKKKYMRKYEEVRKGLVELKTHIRENRQTFLDRDKMPKDWPALAGLKTVKDLEGDYTTESFHLLATWLFDEELTTEQQFGTDIVRITRDSDSSILVIAITGGKELGRRVISLVKDDKGYSFTTKQGADEWELYEGGSTTVITLYRNTEGDLILKWVFTFFGKQTKESLSFEDVSVSWEKAKLQRP